jgi:hypothetical protein
VSAPLQLGQEARASIRKYMVRPAFIILRRWQTPGFKMRPVFVQGRLLFENIRYITSHCKLFQTTKRNGHTSSLLHHLFPINTQPNSASLSVDEAISLAYSVGTCDYLKVIIICRYIFLRFWLKMRFASTKFCDLYMEMVQGRHILMFYSACSY